MNDLTFDEKQKLWTSVDTPPHFNQNVSLGQVMLNSLKSHGTRVAQVRFLTCPRRRITSTFYQFPPPQISADSDITLRYDQLLSRSIRVAQNLRQLGYRKGQMFGFSARNSQHVAPIIFAAWYLGCPVMAIDDSFGKKEFTNMLKITRPILIFSDIKLYGIIRECLDDLGMKTKIFTIGGQIGSSRAIEELLAENDAEGVFV